MMLVCGGVLNMVCTAEKAGAVLVDEVVPGGHAAAAGVKPGDMLLATMARAQVRNQCITATDAKHAEQFLQACTLRRKQIEPSCLARSNVLAHWGAWS